MKFKVKVTLTATQTFEYEIDEVNERKAGDAALDKAMDAFSVTRVDIADDVDIETEQQTRDCARCGKEFKLLTNDRTPAEAEAWAEDDDYCAKCGVLIMEEEKAGTQ